MKVKHDMEKRGMRVLASVVLAASAVCFAEDGEVTDIKSMATHLTANFQAVGEMIYGLATVAGAGFGVAALFKFKQHKDNPTQVPIGTPIALIAISAGLIFLPGFYAPLGNSIGIKDQAGGFAGGGATNLPGNDTES